METDYEKFVNELNGKIKQEYGQDIFDNPKVSNFKNSRSAHLIYHFELESNRIKKLISKSTTKLWKKLLKITG